MSLYLSRGSLSLAAIAAVIAVLGYAVSADSPLPVVVAMAVMSWSILTPFVTGSMLTLMPIAVHHE